MKTFYLSIVCMVMSFSMTLMAQNPFKTEGDVIIASAMSLLFIVCACADNEKKIKTIAE